MFLSTSAVSRTVHPRRKATVQRIPGVQAGSRNANRTDAHVFSDDDLNESPVTIGETPLPADLSSISGGPLPNFVSGSKLAAVADGSSHGPKSAKSISNHSRGRSRGSTARSARLKSANVDDKDDRAQLVSTISRPGRPGAAITILPQSEAVLRGCSTSMSPAKDPTEVSMALLGGLGLTGLGDTLPLCSQLLVLDLHSNSLQDDCINALSGCINLLKLDLSDNQLTTLPGPAFWSGLSKLRILHLHNNALAMPLDNSNLEESPIHCLAEAPHLAILTLHGTPLAQHHGYRHYAANLIWSLVALDGHIISDGEIIAGVAQAGRFSPLSPIYTCSTYVRDRRGTSVNIVLNRLYALIFTVHLQQARTSPVRILQRWVKRLLEQRRSKFSAKQNIPNAPTSVSLPASMVRASSVPQEEHFAVDAGKLLTAFAEKLALKEEAPQSDYLAWVMEQRTCAYPPPVVLREQAFSHSQTISLPKLEIKVRPSSNSPYRCISTDKSNTYASHPKIIGDVLMNSVVATDVSSDEPVTDTNFPNSSRDEVTVYEENQTGNTIILSKGRRTKIGPCAFLKPLLHVEQDRKSVQQQRDSVCRAIRVQTIREEQRHAKQQVADHKKAIGEQAARLKEEHESMLAEAEASRKAKQMTQTQTHMMTVQAAAKTKADRISQREDLLQKQRLDATQQKAELRKEIEEQRVKQADEIHHATSVRRETRLRNRAEVYRVMAALREFRADDRSARKFAVANQADQIRKMELDLRRSRVLRVSTMKSERASLRGFATSAKSREKPFLHGMAATPVTINGREPAKASMKPSIYTEPGPNFFFDPEALPADAYPKTMWDGLPRALTHKALVEEYEDRWREIGTFCAMKACRVRPLYSCKKCYRNFREFAATGISKRATKATEGSITAM